MRLNALGIADRFVHHLLFRSPSRYPSSIRNIDICCKRFSQQLVKQNLSKNKNGDKMAEDQPQEYNIEDVMSQSFGEAYATRCDEEGFGGIYGGNQNFKNPEADNKIVERNHEYDVTQQSGVKEVQEPKPNQKCKDEDI